ncbi:MAG: 23S rRNA (guanosine(2251)-2'-O)-methyltransferase RlmB [Lachnospiraceae bacterium]|nr:23S rRNA (guanosine(2251)-2'-O)-methyltransferase RlmB [Lachnospiraceae bacterium]
MRENQKKNYDGRAAGRRAEADPEVSESLLVGRNSVAEAFRAGRTVEKLFVQKGLDSGPIQSIIKQAKKSGCVYKFVDKDRLEQICGSDRHQGVAAFAAAWNYAEVGDILAKAREAGEDPFIVIADGIQDPHNLGAIIRSAHQAGAHGLIIPKRRSVGMTQVVVAASAGAVHYLPVAKVTNLTQTIKDLQKEGIWFSAADMGGENMYDCDLTGPVGIVVGAEGSGVSRLVKETCDRIVSIPMKGQIDSLNASVAAGILAFEVMHQRDLKARKGQ